MGLRKIGRHLAWPALTIERHEVARLDSPKFDEFWQLSIQRSPSSAGVQHLRPCQGSKPASTAAIAARPARKGFEHRGHVPLAPEKAASPGDPPGLEHRALANRHSPASIGESSAMCRRGEADPGRFDRTKLHRSHNNQDGCADNCHWLSEHDHHATYHPTDQTVQAQSVVGRQAPSADR